MRRILNIKLWLIGLGLISLFISPHYASAAFSFSVRPYAGGYDLDFGKISPGAPQVNQEAVVNITSTIGKQYRLIQTLLDPLTNEQGITLSRNNLFVYGIRGTNKYGTLGVEQERPVYLDRTVIYTSDSSGLSDSFTLVYGIKGPFDVPPGTYRGRISFTLEPFDSTQEPSTQILNIYANIEIESKIEIKTADETKVVALSSTKEEANSADVSVEITGSMGSQFKIMQILDDNPISPEGYRLQEGAVKFSIKGASLGSGITTPSSLSDRPEAIYTSNARGDPEAFTITYSLGDLTKEKAGRYRATLKYLIEGSGYLKKSLIDTLTLEVQNERVFNLVVKPEMGAMIQFRDLKPQEPPRTNEVVLEVKTNTAKPYQVSQGISSLFTNKKGETIPSNYFALRTESLDTKGILKYPIKAEAKIGESALFISDKLGSPDTFKVIYELAIPPDLHAGDYGTNIVYSLSEI